MTQSSPSSVGCNPSNEGPQCHVVDMVDEEKKDAALETLVLLKSVTISMLEQLSERVDTPATNTTTNASLMQSLLTKTSTSGGSHTSYDPGPRCCRPVVLHWAHGVTAFLLLVGTVYQIGRGLPRVDARTQVVEEPTEGEEFEGLVGTVCLIFLWMAFLVLLRLTCRYSFPVERAAEEEHV